MDDDTRRVSHVLFDPVDDDRGASEVVGFALLLAIVVIGIAAILLVAGPQLAAQQQGTEVSHAEQALTQFDSDAARVATGGTSSRRIDLGLRGNRGTLDVDSNDGQITVEYLRSFDETPSTIVDRPLGTVRYVDGTTTVGYQGGGVWRSDGTDSTMVSPPEFTYRNETLSLPIVSTRRGGSVHSDVEIRPGASPAQRFPDGSDSNLSNTVDTGVLTITIESRYYSGWAQFFEAETNAQVVTNPGAELVEVTFFGSAMDFAPDAGIIATSGPGEIRVEGSGSYIDSYNSSNGPYSESSTEDGIVKAAGDIGMYGGSQIRGDVESNKLVNLSGGATITGDVSAAKGWETDGDSTIEGSTDYDADVPNLKPIDGIVENRLEELAADNDNHVDGITDENLDFDGDSEIELSPGEYYLEDIDIQDGETLVLNATEGDIHIGVEEYVVLDEGHIEVLGDNTDGTVQVYVGSTRSSGVKVPGGGNYMADHFYVDDDSSVRVENDRSPRFQVLAPAHFTGAIRASGGSDPQVTASILAPAGQGPGEFLVRDGELFGAIVTGNLTAENNAEIHFDRAILDEEIPFGEGVSWIEYLYVTIQEIEVSGS